ncbi:MAG: glycoside hydrolase family 16 protein [Rhodospirillales bacterium]|nr:glycoside hydrolase family 16 protein [Rhodospirillales bacterium]
MPQATPPPPAAAPSSADCWTLSFHDDFDHLDLWSEAGGIWKTSYVWGNDIVINEELQYYVDPRVHGVMPFRVADSVLSIEAAPAPKALQSAIGGQEYTSGLITTEQAFAQLYGYFEVRAQIPAGQGLWPAFWMLPSVETWPEGVDVLPEIDVLEALGQDPATYHTTVHSNAGATTANQRTHSVGDLSAGFHDFGVDWSPSAITFYLDRKPLSVVPTPPDMHTPMYVLLNLAVGGWAGAPDKSTEFPAHFRIDRVRVYRRAEAAPAACEAGIVPGRLEQSETLRNETGTSMLPPAAELQALGFAVDGGVAP